MSKLNTGNTINIQTAPSSIEHSLFKKVRRSRLIKSLAVAAALSLAGCEDNRPDIDRAAPAQQPIVNEIDNNRPESPPGTLQPTENSLNTIDIESLSLETGAEREAALELATLSFMQTTIEYMAAQGGTTITTMEVNGEQGWAVGYNNGIEPKDQQPSIWGALWHGEGLDDANRYSRLVLNVGYDYATENVGNLEFVLRVKPEQEKLIPLPDKNDGLRDFAAWLGTKQAAEVFYPEEALMVPALEYDGSNAVYLMADRDSASRGLGFAPPPGGEYAEEVKRLTPTEMYEQLKRLQEKLKTSLS